MKERGLKRVEMYYPDGSVRILENGTDGVSNLSTCFSNGLGIVAFNRNGKDFVEIAGLPFEASYGELETKADK